MEFKRATAQDVDIYVALEKSAGGIKLYSAITDKNEARKEIENNVVYLIVKNGEAIGQIAYQMKDKDRAYLSGLVIKPEYQGKGFAHHATEKLLEELKWVKTVYLVTHPDNVRVIKLSNAFGFKLTSRHDNYFGDGEPRIELTLNR